MFEGIEWFDSPVKFPHLLMIYTFILSDNAHLNLSTIDYHYVISRRNDSFICQVNNSLVFAIISK